MREVEVRQWAVEHDRRGFAEDVICLGGAPANHAGDVAQLFFAIAADEHSRLCRFLRRLEAGHRAAVLRPPLADAGQLPLEPVAEPGVVRFVGEDHVDRGDTGQTAEQIEIHRPQAARIRRMIGDADNDVIEWQRRLRRQERAPEGMLVDRAGRRDRALVGEEREAEKRRLVDEPFAATVGAALDAQLVEQRARKPAHRPLPPLQLVIEVEHHGDQTRPKLEWSAGHVGAGSGHSRAPLEQDFALDARHPARRARQRGVQLRDPLIAGHQVGQNHGGATGTPRAGFDRLPEQFGRRSGRDDDGAAARRARTARDRQFDERGSKSGEAARANQRASLHERDQSFTESRVETIAERASDAPDR